MAAMSSSEEPLVVDDGYAALLASWTACVPCSQEIIHGVASLDIQFDDPPSHLWARIFLPESISSSPPDVLFPLVLHFHGGGMCVGSPANTHFHSFCSRMAVKSKAIWISANYRLAPQHRLPAAYDDAYSALEWLHDQACAHLTGGARHDWLSHADFSRCFITGESAGATITHFLAVRAQQSGKVWKTMKIRGLMLVQVAFFKEVPPMKPFMDTLLTSEHVEQMFSLSLPPGAEVGHPYWNPLHPESPKLSEIELPAVLVAVAERDLCYEGGMEYYEALKEAGKEVELFTSQGKGHGFHFVDPEGAAAIALENRLSEFINVLF